MSGRKRNRYANYEDAAAYDDPNSYRTQTMQSGYEYAHVPNYSGYSDYNGYQEYSNYGPWSSHYGYGYSGAYSGYEPPQMSLPGMYYAPDGGPSIETHREYHTSAHEAPRRPSPTYGTSPPPSSSPPRAESPNVIIPAPSPTPSYLELALSPSTSLTTPDCSPARKLLILDLNGTLLIRSKRGSRVDGPSKLRAVHPRPYMPAFRSYLFSEHTRAWLDVMVWSSAQPHSVADMVSHCFRDKSEGLIAVWARDTLGLSGKDYHRKSETTKDLSKPWQTVGEGQHSARTTILLDDSPRKAARQPWNHVCIPEYDNKLRFADLELLQNGGNDEAAAFDDTLLAVIGVLDAVRAETNVAGWIRAGGLWGKSCSSSPPTDNAENPQAEPQPIPVQDMDRTERPTALPAPPGSALGTDSPSASASVGETAGNDNLHVDPHAGMWFERRAAQQHWVARGLRALEALGIEAVHGLDR